MSVLKFKDPELGKWIEITGLQGEKGNDGYTPIKGVDYWTQEDIQEIKSSVGVEPIEVYEFTNINNRDKINDSLLAVLRQLYQRMDEGKELFKDYIVKVNGNNVFTVKDAGMVYFFYYDSTDIDRVRYVRFPKYERDTDMKQYSIYISSLSIRPEDIYFSATYSPSGKYNNLIQVIQYLNNEIKSLKEQINNGE